VKRASLVPALALLAACGTTADLVITGGAVWTGATNGAAQPGALAIKDGRIIAVGDSAAIARYVGGATEVLDARGGMIMPGFADGHTHFIDGGFQLASVNLRDAATPQEFIRRLGAYARSLKPGDWILGGDWDHELWPGAPLPRRSWIDSVTPQNPVFVSRLDGHMALANSAALRVAHVTRDTPTPAGGEIPRDPRTNEPLGIFKDQAMNLVADSIPPPSPERRDSALARGLAHAASLGVTHVVHVSLSWPEVASWRRLRRAGRLTLRATLYPLISGWRAVADSMRADPGDDMLRIGGVKGVMDGSAGSRTAYFFEPFSDSAGYSGILTTAEADMRAWVGAADSVGLQVVVHAIGDRANALLLDIFDSVSRAHGPRDRRFRIEHAQHLRQQDLPRFAQLGVIASMQPYHAIDDGRWLERRIGPARSRYTYAFRSLTDAGARLAFGSDWSVAPLNPIAGVYAAVTRRTIDGKHPDGWVAEEKITVGETLRAYTSGNAYGVFAESKWGTLAPRYYADVVVLDRDLFRTPPDSLDRVRVRYTIVDGRVVFRGS
jgi:predicted amidohydrolase YtcJ